MIGKTERVVLVKGSPSKWYDQAIFIVNQNAPKESMPLDFVTEAEKIIQEYNLTQENGKSEAQKSTASPLKDTVRQFSTSTVSNKPDFALMLSIMMAIASVAITAIFVWGLFR